MYETVVGTYYKTVANHPIAPLLMLFLLLLCLFPTTFIITNTIVVAGAAIP
eukprot:m.70969 g.70969  ORF g.70969 m.70969 type:complete len:51 (-) comp8329_c0_seq1:993-1145(-)